MKLKLLILLCILFQFSCKKDLTPDWELTQPGRNLVVFISTLPNEPYRSYGYSGKVIFYKSYQDLFNETNEIASLMSAKASKNGSRSVMLTNVTLDEIYIRVQSINHYSSNDEEWSFMQASYYYNGVVKMSPYNVHTNFNAGRDNLIKEK